MNFAVLQKKATQLVTENATAIFTGVGAVGVVATAVLAAKAGYKAALRIEEEDFSKVLSENDGHIPTMAKVKLIWPQFIPPVVVGSATIVSIVMSNRVSAKRAAALAAAYGISEQKLQEYRGKVLEKVTGPKGVAIDDEIAQDRVNGHPAKSEVLIIANGDVLCYDMYTDRYFRSTVERIKRAENDINGELFHVNYASLSSFYDKIGLKPTSFSDDVGWNLSTTGAVDLRISTTQSSDGQPCIAFDFIVPPRPEYNQQY